MSTGSQKKVVVSQPYSTKEYCIKGNTTKDISVAREFHVYISGK